MGKDFPTIRIAKAADLQPIRLFLRKFFCTDEPLSRSIQLTTDENPINENFEKYILQFYGKGCDLIAECGDKIAGVCLNVLVDRGTHQEEFPCPPNDKSEKIIRLIEYLEETVDYFRYPDIDRIMIAFILSVNPSFRRKGIGKKLLARSREIAKENKAGIVIVECTSAFSAAACKSVGFDKIFSLNYTDYKKNGDVVFRPGHPHKAVTVYASKLE